MFQGSTNPLLALMSCKGLVELIVLNIGLQAKILSQRTVGMTAEQPLQTC